MFVSIIAPLIMCAQVCLCVFLFMAPLSMYF